MKLSKILVLAALPLALAACSVSTRSVSVAPVKPPQIARSDSKLLRLCALPVDLGDKPLAQEQVEDLWITDRQALLDCYRRHLRNFVLNATADWRVVHERRGIDGRNRLFYHAGWRAWSRVEGKVKVVEDKADKVISDLAAHKLHVAKTCTTKSGMKEIKDEILGAVSGLKDDLRHLTSRIDGMHDTQSKARPSRRAVSTTSHSARLIRLARSTT